MYDVGFLTAAYKNNLYVVQALNLVFSLRVHNNSIPVSIVTDDITRKWIFQNKVEHWFDKIIIGDNSKLKQFQGKLYSAELTPYMNTIYFDSDCLIIKDPKILIKELFTEYFTVPSSYLYPSDTYYSIDMKEWLNAVNLVRLPVFNAGVFGFRKEGIKIIRDAISIIENPYEYRLPKSEGGYNEQVAIGIAMEKNRISGIDENKDLHFSFYNADDVLELDLSMQFCKFMKDGIIRNPVVFHYTPLYHAGYYFSESRNVLLKQLKWLNNQFVDRFYNPLENPNFKQWLSLYRQFRFIKDSR